MFGFKHDSANSIELTQQRIYFKEYKDGLSNNLSLADLLKRIQQNNTVHLKYCHFLSEYFDFESAKQYVELLDELLQNDINANEVFNLLKPTHPHPILAWGCFQSVPSIERCNIIHAYLTLLNKLYAAGINALDILSFLCLRNSSSVSMGFLIIWSNQKALTDLYLKLLQGIAVKDPMPVFDFLNLLSNSGSTLGIAIGLQDDSDIIQAYFTLLDILFQSGVPVKELLDYLSAQVKLNSFTSLIARNDTHSVLHYLNLLEKWQQKDMNTASHILEFLKQSPINDVSFGHRLAMRRDRQVICQYLTLLNQLKLTGVNAFELVKMQDTYHHTFIDLIAIYHHDAPAIIFYLARNGFLQGKIPPEFFDQKGAIFKYICTLERQEKETALMLATNNKHPLNHLLDQLKHEIANELALIKTEKILEDMPSEKNLSGKYIHQFFSLNGIPKTGSIQEKDNYENYFGNHSL